MTQDFELIEGFDPESSILFLGSGFSLGAKNIARGAPPMEGRCGATSSRN